MDHVASNPVAAEPKPAGEASAAPPPSTPASAPALPPVPAVGSVAEFEGLVGQVEKAAHEWGLRSDSLESRFVTALLGCTRWMGSLSEASRESLQKLVEQNRLAAADDLLRAKEINRAASLALSQARNAQLGYMVEQENVVVRMIDKTLPMFIERMQGTLVLREKRLNAAIRRRGYVVAGLVTLGLFVGGYGARAWQDAEATGLVGQCLAQPYHAAGHVYCDITRLSSTPPPAR